MATVSHITLVNIVSVTQGSNTYEGVRSVTLSYTKGRVVPKLKEGHLYPTGADNVGTADFPVRTSVTIEQTPVNVKAMLNEAVGDLVVVYKRDAGAGNVTATIKNHQFTDVSEPQGLQDRGVVTLNGVAYAESGGSAIPLDAVQA